MIVLAVHFDQLRLEVGAGLGKDGAQPTEGVAIEHSAAVFHHKDQMDVYLKSTVPSLSSVVVIAYGPRV
ncbi:hypothetical protein AKN87_03475 [Thiopseudomonas alkaliphila]|nr:hypothetical protein AKN87_03475 [Thiopseudomonas alkaliphila]AKX46456.1 hypothetical protein AKN94_03115 [Thiopseudomonas alkaliphila]AKX46751.1 hypothetical protein AKN94_04785 [Thiopseudomonas alkaliphila]AKX49527.1 hypothetical protein AKN93_09095 [Thiopseudomonas alkaliphila]AKX52563.1 hypothetical protein AKN91_01870 [Thiopseudomonas alkaliphila]